MTESDGPERGVLGALAALGIPFERIECDPAVADTAAFCARYGYPPETSANTIVVVSKKEPRQYAVCVVRASTLLDVNHVVRKLLGASRVSFASAEETTCLTGMLVGGVTPFNLPEHLPVFVDEGVMQLDSVILGGGGRSSKIKVSPETLTRLANVRIVPGLALERSSSA